MNIRNAAGWLLAMVMIGTIPALAGETGCNQPRSGTKPIKVGIVLSTDDPETVFNVFRLANFSADSGDTVSVFLLGKGVMLDRIKDPKFDIAAQVSRFLTNGQKIMACATCLKFHESPGSEICPIFSMQDLYDLIRSSDRVLTF
jgi:uncharacterized protein involved in oxidation of intracellular sulfur